MCSIRHRMPELDFRSDILMSFILYLPPRHIDTSTHSFPQGILLLLLGHTAVVQQTLQTTILFRVSYRAWFLFIELPRIVSEQVALGEIRISAFWALQPQVDPGPRQCSAVKTISAFAYSQSVGVGTP